MNTKDVRETVDGAFCEGWACPHIRERDCDSTCHFASPTDDVREEEMPSPQQVRRLIAELNEAGYEVRLRGTATEAEQVRVFEKCLQYRLLPDAVREYMSGYVEAAKGDRW